MYYQVTVAFDMGSVDNQGNPKVKKFKYIIESESVFEAHQRMSKYLSDDARDSEVVSVIKAPIEDVIHPGITPQYY
jgi:hypothetical protein